MTRETQMTKYQPAGLRQRRRDEGPADLPAEQTRASGVNQRLNGLVRLIRWLGAVVWLSSDELKQAGVHLGNQHD